MEILSKTYDGESMCDIDRDVSECFDHHFNPDVVKIPVDKHGFPKGAFKVVITWEE